MSETFRELSGFRTLFAIRTFVLVIAIASVDSIRTGNVPNVETVVLRERFPKCTYGLIYGILRLALRRFSPEIFRVNARDYGDTITVNCTGYDVISHSVFSKPIRSVIFCYFFKSCRVSFIRMPYDFIYFIQLSCTRK